MSWIETAGKVSYSGHLHQVSPEELTLVYNLRKIMMNNWVSSSLYRWAWGSPLRQPRADGRKATNVTPLLLRQRRA